MAKKESRFLHQQKIAVGVFVTALVGIVAYLSWMTLEEAPLGEFVEGEHYQLIDDPRRIRSDQIEVMEFFSYACVHCYNFDPELTSWVDQQGDNVNFVRMPAVASDYWRLLGRNYFVLEHLNVLDEHHMRFFRAIHDSRQTFTSSEALADFFEQAGLEEGAYETAYRSAEVNSLMARADQMARRLKVASVPTIVVQGKYMVRTTSAIGPKRMLEVMDYLVERERDALSPES